VKSIDTNVLVRFLVNDEPRQSKLARDLFHKAEVSRDRLYVSNIVLLETLWVLESAYDVDRDSLIETLHELLLMPVLALESRELVQAVMAGARAGKAELSDLLIGYAAQLAGCETTLTFDKVAARLPVFKLLD
jgi:predicted nucleic-acid-binding protein